MPQIPRIKDHWRDLFNPWFRRVDSEICVFGDLNSNRTTERFFGRIDHLVEYHCGRWLIEEDLAGGDKWHWAKILAYRAAYILDNPSQGLRALRLGVFLNQADFSYPLQNILSFLGVEFFFFEIGDQGIRIVKTSRPEVVRWQATTKGPNLRPKQRNVERFDPEGSLTAK